MLISSIKCDGKLWGTINADWMKQVGVAFEDDCSGQLIERKDLWVGGQVRVIIRYYRSIINTYYFLSYNYGFH